MTTHLDPPLRPIGALHAGGAVGFGSPVAQDDGAAVVELRGQLSPADRTVVRDRLTALLRAHRCLLLDLNRLRITSTRVLEVLTSALDHAGGWPDARLAVFTDDRLLRQALVTSGTAEYLWVSHSPDLAVTRCVERPRRVRATWSAAPEAEAAGRLRALVHRRWTEWGLPDDVIDEALLVVNELVSNAVDHARSALRLHLLYDGSLLRIRVRDLSHESPQLRPHDVTAARGRGLQMVDSLATRWGWARHDDGKTVWATVAIA